MPKKYKKKDKAEKAPRKGSKISSEDKAKILKRLKNGEKKQSIADDYGVSYQAIYKIEKLAEAVEEAGDLDEPIESGAPDKVTHSSFEGVKKLQQLDYTTKSAAEESGLHLSTVNKIFSVSSYHHFEMNFPKLV